MDAILNYLSGHYPNIITFILFAFAVFKAYKKVMKGIEETRHMILAGVAVQNAFQKAYADGKITKDEIEEIEDAIEKSLNEGKQALEAWSEAKEEILVLIEKAKSRRRIKK